MHLGLTNNFTLHDSGTHRRKQWMSLRKLLHNPTKRNVLRSIGLIHECHVKMQNALVAYCKKKSRELHRVKSEEFKCQTAKRIGKKNYLRERQKQKSLHTFKYAYWINQQLYPSRLWNTTKKSMDEFEKIIAQSK